MSEILDQYNPSIKDDPTVSEWFSRLEKYNIPISTRQECGFTIYTISPVDYYTAFEFVELFNTVYNWDDLRDNSFLEVACGTASNYSSIEQLLNSIWVLYILGVHEDGTKFERLVDPWITLFRDSGFPVDVVLNHSYDVFDDVKHPDFLDSDTWF